MVHCVHCDWPISVHHFSAALLWEILVYCLVLNIGNDGH